MLKPVFDNLSHYVPFPAFSIVLLNLIYAEILAMVNINISAFFPVYEYIFKFTVYFAYFL